MVKLISCVTSHCGNRCKALSTQNTCLVNIILLVAEIIPDNWHYFSFWYQVFVCANFSCCCSFFNVVTSDSHVQGRGLLQHTELELMWLVDSCACRVCMHSVCLVPLKLDEFIFLLPCDYWACTLWLWCSNDISCSSRTSSVKTI